MCSATVLNGIVGKALQSSVYSEITEHAQHIAFALKTLPDIFKQNGKCIIFFVPKVNLSLHVLEQLSNDYRNFITQLLRFEIGLKIFFF